jgi:cysteine desulfurase family protein (TIGR01976 family)
MPTATTPSIEQIRARFPSLANGEAFMDNAGGSQVPGCVADAVREFMLTSYVQVGADYPASKRATQTVADAHAMVNTIMGGDGVGRTTFGSSSTSLCRMLSDCYAEALQPGDEIVVGESGHEANVGPWARLGSRGLNVKIWRANPETGVCELSELQRLLTNRTKVVAFVQVSNILGQVEDFQACIDVAHEAGARVVLDGVAYAPHLPMDMAAWGVDWYVMSCYKVFGPHIGAMFGRHEAFAELTGPNHYFLANDYLPGKFELGGSNMESCGGLLGLQSYLSFLAGREEFDRETVIGAWRAMEELERPLTARFLDFLNSKAEVKVVGSSKADSARVPTISFLHAELSPKEIADRAMDAGIGMRAGNFYSVRLLERMGIDPKSGVARASFAHYNSMEEVDRLIAALDPVL